MKTVIEMAREAGAVFPADGSYHKFEFEGSLERFAELVRADALAEQPAQPLPFGVGGGLVAIKTLLSRDPCVHANTAIQMIDSILAEQPAQEPAPLRDAIVVNLVREGINKHKARELADHFINLTNAQQEPVAYLCENAVGHKYFRWKKPSSTYKPIALYTTPPAQLAVPDAIGPNEDELPSYAAGWNDCRALMLEMRKP